MSRHVGVFTRCTVWLSTSSRRQTTDLARNLEIEQWTYLSYGVELCQQCEHRDRLSWPTHYFVPNRIDVGHEYWEHGWRLSCRRMHPHRWHDENRLRCREICSDSWRFAPTFVNSIHTADATQRDCIDCPVVGVNWVWVNYHTMPCAKFRHLFIASEPGKMEDSRRKSRLMSLTLFATTVPTLAPHPMVNTSLPNLNKKAVLSQGEPRDAAVNFDCRILQ